MNVVTVSAYKGVHGPTGMVTMYLQDGGKVENQLTPEQVDEFNALVSKWKKKILEDKIDSLIKERDALITPFL